MKRIFFSAALLSSLFVGSAKGQDIYKVQTFTNSDLNGDARFVGMGGAMSALGANISAMSSNPASAGLYRLGDMAISGSILKHSGNNDVANYLGSSSRKSSLDQLGFVYPLFVNGENLKFVNFGFNYRKSQNFHRFFNIDDASLPTLDNPNAKHDGFDRAGASQTWQLVDLARTDQGFLDLDTDAGAAGTAPISAVATDIRLLEPITDNKQVVGYHKTNAEAYHLRRAQWGAIEAYDFNVSTNYNDRFYIGANIGLYNLSYHTAMEYQELSLNNEGKYFLAQGGERKTYLMQQNEHISGTGVDAKFGFLVRPLADSPFRLGLSLTTPIFYMLSASNYVFMESPVGGEVGGRFHDYIHKETERNYDYRLRTPWKVNVSLGTTIGHRLALAAEYEIADHLTGQVRHLGNGYFNYDSSNGSIDKVQQKDINKMLRDTHTLRLGAEMRLSPEWYGRAGYNFVSSPYDKSSFLRLYSDSPSLYNAMNTDYVNLGDTHRFTCGIGYRSSDFYVDLAYQYQTQKAEAYPFFYDTTGPQGTRNAIAPQSLDLDRTQFALTLGYRF